MNTRLQDIVEKLQHKSAELESIIAHMLNGLIAVDGQLHVVQMNGAAKHMLGVTGNVEGKHVLEATGNSRLEAGLQEAMEHEELFTLELPVRAAPRHRLIRLYISPAGAWGRIHRRGRAAGGHHRAAQSGADAHGLCRQRHLMS